MGICGNGTFERIEGAGIMSVRDWTDEELILVYDLQKRYAERVVDFVRHGEEDEVKQLLKVLPELHYSGDYEIIGTEIYLSSDMEEEVEKLGLRDNKYIYKSMFDKWKGADSLREIFEENYQIAVEEGRPEVIALFAGNEEKAIEEYTKEGYEKLKKEIPRRLMYEVESAINQCPKRIREKAMEEGVYGYVDIINRRALTEYRNAKMPEFEKIKDVTQNETAETIVAAYDLQMGLKMYHSDLRGKMMREAIRYYQCEEEVFEILYGRKATEILRSADEKTIRLAKKFDFVNTEEKLPILENHKICMYGTLEQKIRIPYKNDPFCVSEKDYQRIIEAEAEISEREGFSTKYYPSKNGNKEYEKQPYKVIGRYQSKEDTENQPQWNIVFEDGKIITAKADEIIPSAIHERMYGRKWNDLPKRKLSEATMRKEEGKLTLKEGSEKISAIINQLQKNGEKSSKLKELLERERKSLSSTNVR